MSSASPAGWRWAPSFRQLRERFGSELTIVNGENAAGGMGINERSAKDIFDAGADLITLGNHAYRQRDSYELLDHDERIVRPANYPKGNPGRGSTTIEVDGVKVGVLNLSGALQLTVARSPFAAADAEVGELQRRGAELIVVDFHAEVTSEKVAMGWHLDGRVAAVLGTHTHVPTADARVLPGGTAFITDVGMTGSRQSILGVRVEDAMQTFTRQMPTRFNTAEEDVWINGVAIETGPDGLATSIEQILVPAGLSPGAVAGGSLVPLAPADDLVALGEPVLAPQPRLTLSPLLVLGLGEQRPPRAPACLRRRGRRRSGRRCSCAGSPGCRGSPPRPGRRPPSRCARRR